MLSRRFVHSKVACTRRKTSNIRRLILGICYFALVLSIVAGQALSPLRAFAQSSIDVSGTPYSIADAIRSRLSEAQLAVTTDKAAAETALKAARTLYAGQFAAKLAGDAATADARITKGFALAEKAISGGDALSLAEARANIRTGLLDGGYQVVEAAIAKSDNQTAKEWLPLREYRRVSRFARPNADATLAVTALAQGTITTTEAALAVRSDLLDDYQGRLDEALRDVSTKDAEGFAIRRVETSALARGYFTILAPSYQEQRGTAALDKANDAFDKLVLAARDGQGLADALAAAQALLQGFRAAPLSQEDQARRAGQMLRYLSLVPLEYSRGVRDGKVVLDLEITEASTFLEGARASFSDLQGTLAGLDKTKTDQAAALLVTLDKQMSDAAGHRSVASTDEVSAGTEQVLKLLREVMPAEWQKHDSSADFDVIGSVLDQMERAVGAGQYDLAESARLEAYAVLESGPEARLIVFAPQLKVPIEDLFWNGQGEHKGLASLIRDRAPLAEVKASRAALDEQLAQASKVVSGNNAPFAVATNAAIIVFREGLEAVLILASLLGSLKMGANRRFRGPIWWGGGLAFIVTALTWLLASSLISSLARYGEALEAVVSLVAIAVLLLITNWFFHKVYWTGWIANFHTKKKQLIGGEMGQILGLVILGFTSIYREGFESVLFLQALVLEAGVATVLAGVALGLAGTFLVGLIVFALQAKLPYKKMLVATGAMIGVVLLIMVGNTVHVMQVVGWLPIHPIPWLNLPYWTGTWLGLFATWEGILLQIAAATFVIGSYFLAEHQRDRKRKTESPQTKTVTAA